MENIQFEETNLALLKLNSVMTEPSKAKPLL